ncbi:hypothetical protein CLF_112371, partial [Clonorchis sinensis]
KAAIIFSLLSSVISAGFIHATSPPNSPPPDKSCLGDNFRRWAANTSEYIQLFPVSEWKSVLLSLLDAEARDIVRDEDRVTGDVFERLRECLTERIHQGGLTVIIIKIDTMTLVFNTDASLPYNHDLFDSLILKKRIKVDGEGNWC